MDELTDRLIASRYGELAFLRALAVVETNKDTVATFFQHRATRDERAPTAREEVMRVAASRCVSGMGAAFRTALESSLSRQAVPRATASQTHRNHGNSRTSAGRMSEANSAPVPPPIDEPVQTMPPPTVPGPVGLPPRGRARMSAAVLCGPVLKFTHTHSQSHIHMAGKHVCLQESCFESKTHAHPTIHGIGTDAEESVTLCAGQGC